MLSRLGFSTAPCILLVSLVFGHLIIGSQTAPITIEEQLRSGRVTDTQPREEINIVFHNSCTGAEKHEVQTERGKNGCINVNVGSIENVIKTDPAGIRLRLFEKDFCEGSSTLFDPKNSSQKEEIVRFKVASFLIVNGNEGTNAFPA